MDKLGIVFSSRLRSAALSVLAFWMLLFLLADFGSVWSMYISGKGSDASISQYWLVNCTFFLPYFLIAAVLLRSLAARLALFHLLRRQIVVPEYTPPQVLSPAEAGLLVDNDFTLDEVAATLKDLELRGCISITKKGLTIELRPADMQDLEGIERAFADTLFQDGMFTTAAKGSSARFLDAGKQLAEATREQLVSGGQLPRSKAPHRVARIIGGTVVWLGVIAQTTLTVYIAMHPTFDPTANSPRYPMNIGEPLLQLAITAIVIAVACGGFRQKSLNDDHGLKNWRYVAGLKMYMEKVYKDRFYRDGKQMATDTELRTFYPYAIALGIEKRFTRQLERALAL